MHCCKLYTYHTRLAHQLGNHELRLHYVTMTQPSLLRPTLTHYRYHLHTPIPYYTARLNTSTPQAVHPHSDDWYKASQGGRPQAHLANERTYLAWIRTGFTSIALGVAVAKFGGIHPSAATTTDIYYTTTLLGQPTPRSITAGSLLISLGFSTMTYGTIRYSRINRQIESGYFIIGSRGKELVVCSIVGMGTMGIAIGVLFT